MSEFKPAAMNIVRICSLLSFALLAAIAATLCDANHAFTGALVYPHPQIGQQPFWTFPAFFLVFFVMAVCYLQIAPLSSKVMSVRVSVSAGNLQAMVESLSAFMMVYLASGVGHEYPALLSLIFYGLFLLRWAASYERGWLLTVAIVLAAGGMLAEGVLGAFGLVVYRHQDMFFVPFWLGGIYMHGAFALREGVRYFVYRKEDIHAIPARRA
jgi:hypothetical protein